MTDQTLTIPKGWKETTLEKTIDLIIDHRGMTPKKMGGDWGTEGYRAISAKSVKGGQIVNELQMNILPVDLYKKWMKDEVQFGDILLTSEAPLGEHIIWKSHEKLVLSQRIFGIRTKKDVLDPFYFNYFIDSDYYKHELKSRESGSTVSGIKQSELVKTKILLPSLPEQKAIASVLSSLDNKIELLREQNKTLETTARVIFKEWFINFNFPGSTGKMVDSELGLIPEGWRVGTVNDVIERASITYRCDKDDLSMNGKTPIFDQGTGGLYGYTERESDFEASKENPVILFTNHTCNMWFVNHPFCAIQNVIPFRGNSKYDIFFIYYMTLGRVTFIEYKGHWPDFEQKEYAIPTPEIANKFAEFVKPLQYKIWNNSAQIQTLSVLRDTLLPKLMKGEVCVKGFNE